MRERMSNEWDGTLTADEYHFARNATTDTPAVTRPHTSVLSAFVRGFMFDEWRDSAACINVPTAWFFPTPGINRNIDYSAARRVCRGCPVRSECRDYAVSAREMSGMWGGLTPDELNELREV